MCIKDAYMGQKGVAHSTKIRIIELYVAFMLGLKSICFVCEWIKIEYFVTEYKLQIYSALYSVTQLEKSILILGTKKRYFKSLFSQKVLAIYLVQLFWYF